MNPNRDGLGSWSLLTDFYQLTMAYGYWKSGMHRRRADFHLFFRKPPFGGGYTISCGLESVLEYLEGYAFSPEDLEYLGTLKGNDGAPVFAPEFLEELGRTKLEVDIDAIPEGRVVFPHQPLLRVSGPLYQAQLLETPLLNLINFQSLIATKAARICYAAQGEPVLEFGLRRAQGVDGALSASRAAYVGGVAATSNVLAGRRYGIPVKGTHAHSWVMAFEDELEAFRAYARAMPNNCVFLVDTYDTLQGVRNAIEVGQELRKEGHEMVGVRLDSGDLADLSISARRMLDAAGFPEAKVVASNDLDESLVQSLKEQGAEIRVWGIGTKLVTAKDQPALGGVYKLAAIEGADGEMADKIKLSEQAIKVSIPGIQQVRRFRQKGRPVADLIFDPRTSIEERPVGVAFEDSTMRRRIPESDEFEDLLVPALRGGQRVLERESLEDIRARCQRELKSFPRAICRFLNPHQYPARIEASLHDRRHAMILEARKASA